MWDMVLHAQTTRLYVIMSHVASIMCADYCDLMKCTLHTAYCILHVPYAICHVSCVIVIVLAMHHVFHYAHKIYDLRYTV